MKVKFTLGIGFVGAEHEEVQDFPECDDMNITERQKYLDGCWLDWAWNYIDGGWNTLDT